MPHGGIMMEPPEIQRVSRSTARVSLAEYFIPGCVGRGLDLDLRVCPPAPAAAVSGNLGILPLWYRGPRTGFSNILGHNR